MTHSMVYHGDTAGAIAVYAEVTSRDRDDEITSLGELHHSLYFMGPAKACERRHAYGFGRRLCISSVTCASLTEAMDKWITRRERVAIFDNILNRG